MPRVSSPPTKGTTRPSFVTPRPQLMPTHSPGPGLGSVPRTSSRSGTSGVALKKAGILNEKPRDAGLSRSFSTASASLFNRSGNVLVFPSWVFDHEDV